MLFFRNKKLFILLIGFIILVSLIGYSIRDRDITFGEKFVNDTVGWVQSLVNAPVTFVTNTISNIDDFRNTYEENKVLREQLAQNKGLIYEAQELREENEELRDLLGVTDSIRDYDPIQATVIARSPEKWLEQVTINKGEQDGVEQNMVVITAEGMVGKVQSTSKLTSTVQLLTGFDPYNRMSATVSREEDNDIFGMIEGYDRETEYLLFRIIEESDRNIEEGELVVTSGMGGTFPAGLVIGEVREVGTDQYGLTKTAFIEPAADMYKLNQVIVVDRSIGNAEPVFEEEEDE
jgi:rod shape-determining protein MreC